MPPSPPSNSVLFLSHGGGPLPLLGDESHQDMVVSLQALAATLPHPRAIIVISAHWESDRVEITAGAAPTLIYDYYGFPPESYQVEYPCPGAPKLANQVQTCLHQAGMDAALNQQRGFDHGLFVPLKIMYPAADIPCLQISLIRSLNPQAHLHIGQALQGLDQENVLIIGSGFSFHNLPAFFAPETPAATAKNRAFDQWLGETIASSSLTESERQHRLMNWDTAPHARFCHPREEHLLPLHVCYGATRRAATQHIQLQILRKQASLFLWSPRSS